MLKNPFTAKSLSKSQMFLSCSAEAQPSQLPPSSCYFIFPAPRIKLAWKHHFDESFLLSTTAIFLFIWDICPQVCSKYLCLLEFALQWTEMTGGLGYGVLPGSQCWRLGAVERWVPELECVLLPFTSVVSWAQGTEGEVEGKGRAWDEIFGCQARVFSREQKIFSFVLFDCLCL